MWKEKIKHGKGEKKKGGERKKERKMHHRRKKKKEQASNLSFIHRRQAGNFKTYTQYNKLFDET